MNDARQQLPPKQTLLLILFPLLGTFVCQRLYLHQVRVQHIYPGGYLVHHLFLGVLIVIPAAFLLAFGTRLRFLAISARVALGIGSAMILDEIAYLVVTKATDQDYVSRVHSTEPSHLSLSQPFSYGSFTSHSSNEHDWNMRTRASAPADGDGPSRLKSAGLR